MGCHDNHTFSHSPNWFIYGNFFSHPGGSREQFGTDSKLSLWCKVGQIRSWGSWFEAENSLFMMFVNVFTLFIRFLLIFLNMQMKLFRIPPLDDCFRL